MQFSIIIPVYNVEPYLERCLDSVSRQTFPDFEAILIDDGSSDGSGAICDRYAVQDARFRVFHQENRGLSGARNTGLEHAAGEWIVFVDSDDWVSPVFLEKLYAIAAHDTADMISYNAEKVEPDGTVSLDRLYHVGSGTMTFPTTASRFRFLTKTFLRYRYGWEAWSRMYRHSVIEKNHLRFAPTWEIMAEDYLFCFQFLLCTDCISWTDDVLYHYAQRNDSLLHQLDMNTVLPKLFRLGELAEEAVVKNGSRLLHVLFFAIYFVILDHHIQNMLWQTPLDSILPVVNRQAPESFHGRYMKKMRRFRLLLRYGGNRKWLKRKY